MQSFGQKCSFRHNPNEVSNQKSSLSKVLKLTNLNEVMDEKVNAVLSSQMFILSQSKISIKSNEFFDNSFKAHQPKDMEET